MDSSLKARKRDKTNAVSASVHVQDARAYRRLTARRLAVVGDDGADGWVARAQALRCKTSASTSSDRSRVSAWHRWWMRRRRRGRMAAVGYPNAVKIVAANTPTAIA